LVEKTGIYHLFDALGKTHRAVLLVDEESQRQDEKMTKLSPVYEYFAHVSQQAMNAKPPYRGRVELLHFGPYVLVKSEISGKLERRWFHDETPIAYPRVHGSRWWKSCSVPGVRVKKLQN
jgi:hypothetical protein